MQTVNTRLLLLTFFICLGGCGLKGPLYLPAEEPAAPASEQDSTGDAAEETDKETKKKDKNSI